MMKKFFAIIYDLVDIIDSASRAAWLARHGHIDQAKTLLAKSPVHER